MSQNTKKKLAAVMFCKFDDYNTYVENDKKLAIKRTIKGYKSNYQLKSELNTPATPSAP